MIKILDELQKDRKDIFSIIQKRGPITKNDIRLLTNMKLTTLNRIISDLLSSELIVEESLGESTGGRKPTLYSVNSVRYYLFGIDISRTYIQIVLMNLKMQMIGEKRISIEEEYVSLKTLQYIGETADLLLKEQRISENQIIAVGVSAVGPLDREKGVQLASCEFEGSHSKCISIIKELESIFKLPVILENGANSAAMAEYLYGSGKDLQNIAYINCGVGIRTGVITSGRIIRSMNDREDAFGHMVIDLEGKSCYCGNYGCVESYVSIPSIMEEYKEELRRGNGGLKVKNPEEITFREIFETARQGDTTARAVIADAAIIFGNALANYIKLLNPELIILSGPTVYRSDVFYRLSTETAMKKINIDNTKIKFSKGGYFKEYAMAVGAAAMAVESSLKAI